jgi:hypothetical protein
MQKDMRSYNMKEAVLRKELNKQFDVRISESHGDGDLAAMASQVVFSHQLSPEHQHLACSSCDAASSACTRTVFGAACPPERDPELSGQRTRAVQELRTFGRQPGDSGMTVGELNRHLDALASATSAAAQSRAVRATQATQAEASPSGKVRRGGAHPGRHDTGTKGHLLRNLVLMLDAQELRFALDVVLQSPKGHGIKLGCEKFMKLMHRSAEDVMDTCGLHTSPS